MERTTPNWQPITALPTIASLIDGMLHETEVQYETLLKAKDRPHVLDDATVARVVEVYTKQSDDHWLFDEQLTRWDKSKLSPPQRKEVARLRKQVERLRGVCTSILDLAAELKTGTIEQVLAKSDLELTMDVLAGKRKL